MDDVKDLTGDRTRRDDDRQGPPDPAVELAARAVDGLQVALFWDEQDGRLRILVADSRTGESFSLWTTDGKEALEFFHHPFAYATARRAVHHALADRIPVGASAMP
jgi:hypothetical protein